MAHFGVIDLASAAPFRTKVVRLDPPLGCSLLDEAAFFDSVAVGPWLIDLEKCDDLACVWRDDIRDQELGYSVHTDLTLVDLRLHLRKFALANVEGHPKPLLFRYFDARIIRTFLDDVFSPDERQKFLAPMQSLEVKAADDHATLVFTPSQGTTAASLTPVVQRA